MSDRKLPRSFYAREALVVARELIGLHLVHVNAHGRQVGRIVETEGYKGPTDLAAHSSRGRTKRTEVMFGPAGHAYVYLIYGFWDCLNVVCATEGVPHAVLIRAVEPVEGVTNTTHGPGLLCRALHVDRSLNGTDVTGEMLWIERPDDYRKPRIERSPRIGVDYAGVWAAKPWRFFDANSAYVSTVTAARRRRMIHDDDATQPSRTKVGSTAKSARKRLPKK
ncbi:MAG TPA: DNA-3-methyladenine glycosylase [Povalibacter sp.]|nr:DNA-3-methyladenine glycosylase [Povalibacter sp.]